MRRFAVAVLLAAAGCHSPPRARALAPPPPEGVSTSGCEAAWSADPRVCLEAWATGLPGARGLAFAPNGDLFVVSRGAGLVVLWDANHDGVSGPGERATFAKEGGNHGLAIHGGYVYASSAVEVFRYRYEPGERRAPQAAEVVVHGLPAGGHVTRTLLFDAQGQLLVSAGSASNVDRVSAPETTRAVIRRFDLARLPPGGFPWTAGETFATGLRNEVGLALDARGRVWGVANGRDGLVVDGVDIHDDNPAEELHRFEVPGRFYGYPFCWTSWKWPGHGPSGTKHLDPDVPGGHDEAWCQNPANVAPQLAVMQAHLAPLGLVFYDGALFPNYRGQLFIAAHGSWDRTPPVGRTLLHAQVGADGDIHEVTTFLGELSPRGQLREGVWKYRPVDLAVGPDGALYFSDDAAGTIQRVGRR